MTDDTKDPTGRFFGDYVPGQVFELGQVRVTEADVIDFASRYDPQPMHVDLEAARNSRFGGLVASGWQTTVLTMRLYVDRFLWHPSSLASPGVDEIRWPHPVRPGDVLRARATVVEATPSRKRDDRGVVRARVEVENQDGQLVFSAIVLSIIARRPSAT